MTERHLYQQLLTAPNLLTCFRFVSAPVLLWLAWHGHEKAFLLLAVTFLSDALDGFVARRTRQVSEFGAILDSWADVVTYSTIALCAWWLWPAVVSREALYVALVIGSYLLPAAVGLFRFGRFTSYHTRAVKLAAVLMAASLFLLFLGGPAWPFRFAALVCTAAALEEIAITLVIDRFRTNIRGIFEVIGKNPGD